MKKLNPQPSYYRFVTNNNTDGTLSVLYDWCVQYDNSDYKELWFKKDAIKVLGNPYGVIGIVRQTLLKMARILNCQYTVFIDDDIFLADKDFISRITAHDKDLVGGAYYRSYPQGELMSYLAFNTKKSKKERPYILRNYQTFKLQKVAAVSGGCMCISNKLLNDKRVNFFPIPDYYNTGHAGEDFSYCVTARKYGYDVFVDDSFRICHYQKHEARPWRVDKNGKYIDFKFEV
jgi:GT2 family glycosyltransferase